MVNPGTVLQNRYLIQKQIGEGGMGTVYLAVDQRFNSPVAIKETLFNDPGLQRAFEREAQLLNGLRHGALPRVSDHFIEGDGQFIVMEYIAGDDLSEMLKQRSIFPLSDVLRWADQLLDALDYLHSQNPPIVHRDIKPQNLKLTTRSEIILLDFGLAKGHSGDTSKLTLAKSIFGYSRSYSPLEQIQGTGTDPRSDLYSLVATLYHLITGKPPVDALTRATKILSGEEDPLITINLLSPEVPAQISQIFYQALALNANVRPNSAAEMRNLLREAAKFVPETEATLKDSHGSAIPALNEFGADMNPNQPNRISSSFSVELNDAEATVTGANEDYQSLPSFALSAPAFSDYANKNAGSSDLPIEAVTFDKTSEEPAPLDHLNQAEVSPSETKSSQLPENFDAFNAAPNLARHDDNRRRTASWFKSAGVAAAIAVLGGGSLAAWYATAGSSNNSVQSNGHIEPSTNVSANQKSNLTADKNPTVVQPNGEIPVSHTVQASSPGGSKATQSASKQVENQDSNEEVDQAPQAEKSKVVVVKSAPPTKNNHAEREDNSRKQREDSPARNPGDDSDIEVHDLRDLPQREREQAIEELNQRRAEAEGRRNQRINERQRRIKEKRRRQQNLPTLLGAPGEDND